MGLHAVEIDHEGITDAFNSYAAGQGGPTISGDHISAGESDTGAPWRAISGAVISFMCAKVCPAWEVPDENQDELAAAVADCLGDLFPGGLGGTAEWGPWAKLAFASGTFALCGFDMQAMAFKPLHLDPPASTQTFTTDQPDAEPTPGGRYTTGV